MTKTNKLLSCLSIVALVGSLTACGSNDDNNNSDNSNASSSSSGNGTTSSSSSSSGGSPAITYSFKYEALTSEPLWADRLAQMNAEGLKGYKYLADYVFSTGSINQTLYVNEGSGPYSYEVLDAQNSSAAFLSQAQAEGARGYRYIGNYSSSGQTKTMYMKNGASNATYSYELLPSSNKGADFLTQANAQGNKGFWYSNDMYFTGDAQSKSIYMTDSTLAASRYSYQLAATPNTSAGFDTQANQYGGLGYKANSVMYFITDGTTPQTIYIKDLTQNTTFSFQSQLQPLSGEAFVSTGNALGDQNYGYMNTYQFSGNGSQDFAQYFKSTNCTGFMCLATKPLTLN